MSGFLKKSIRQYVQDEVTKEERKSVISVSLLITGITEMGVGNVGFFTDMLGLVTILAQTRIIIMKEKTYNHI